MRSSSPPKPGRRTPVSFTSKSRFTSDSIRSPHSAAAATVGANTERVTTLQSSGTANHITAKPSPAPSRLPNAPVQVLPGLIAGASRGPASTDPLVNANTSESATAMPMSSSRGTPSGWTSRM